MNCYSGHSGPFPWSKIAWKSLYEVGFENKYHLRLYLRYRIQVVYICTCTDKSIHRERNDDSDILFTAWMLIYVNHDTVGLTSCVQSQEFDFWIIDRCRRLMSRPSFRVSTNKREFSKENFSHSHAWHHVNVKYFGECESFAASASFCLFVANFFQTDFV